MKYKKFLYIVLCVASASLSAQPKWVVGLNIATQPGKQYEFYGQDQKILGYEIHSPAVLGLLIGHNFPVGDNIGLLFQPTVEVGTILTQRDVLYGDNPRGFYVLTNLLAGFFLGPVDWRVGLGFQYETHADYRMVEGVFDPFCGCFPPQRIKRKQPTTKELNWVGTAEMGISFGKAKPFRFAIYARVDPIGGVRSADDPALNFLNPERWGVNATYSFGINR